MKVRSESAGFASQRRLVNRAATSAMLIRVDSEIEEEGWLDDAVEWQGPTISSIQEVLALIDD